MRAQTTPSISGIQSDFSACFSACTGAHDNAITAGAAPPPSAQDDLQLFINGTFNVGPPAFNFEQVTWTEGTTTTNLTTMGQTSTQVVVNVPLNPYPPGPNLWAPNGQTTPRTITITVYECAGGYSYSRLRPHASCPSTTATYIINPPLANVTNPLPSGEVTVPYSQNFFSGGTPPYATTLTQVPTGLSPTTTTVPPRNLSSTGNPLAGTPAQFGQLPLSGTVTDSWNNGASTTTTLAVSNSMNVIAGPTVAAPQSLPQGNQNQAYTPTQLTPSGGTGTYVSWTIANGPPGLSISSSGLITGTPTTPGTYQRVAVRVTDSAGGTGTVFYTVQINPALQINTTALPGGIVGQAYSYTASAMGGISPYSWSATGLPATLPINSSGLISGTPSAAATYTVNLTVNDSGQGPGHQTNSVNNLSLVVVNPLTISTTQVPNAFPGQSYSTTIVASGGTPNYTWSMAGLPGFTISSTGVISGTAPSTGGNYPFTVTVSDSGAPNQIFQTKTANLTLVVNPALTIPTPSLPAGVQGQTYNATVAANGGVTPYTWSQTGLPAGLAINASTGAISGTPTVSGTFQVVVTVKDSGGSAQQTQQATYSLSIGGGLTITTASLPQGRVQLAYSATVAASGGTTPFSWTATALPTGLSINATTGAITGTPTAAGTFNTVVTVTDNYGTKAQATLPIQIIGLLTISYISTPGGQVGQPYSGLLQATGGVQPYNWTQTGLPAGLTLSSSGAITGTPSVAGNYPVTFKVTDSSSLFPQSAQTNTITLNITPPPPPPLQITTSSLPNGVAGQLYVAQVAATGGAGSYAFTVVSGSAPAGVALALSGQLYGTPTTPGSSTFTVQVTDGNNNTATRSLTIQIAPGTLAVTGAPPSSVAVNSAVSVQFGATGGVSPYKFTLSGSAPGGTSLSPTGLLSGTASTPGTFNFSVTVSDSQMPPATATGSFSITVTPATINITANLPAGTVGLSYSGQLSATGGTGGFTWSGTAGDGLTVSSSGAVSGTPTSVGTVAVAVTVTDSSGTKATGNFSITINGPTLMVATTSLPNGALTSAYSGGVSATGGTPPYTWSATGLPAGLSLDPASGNITGTPTAPGTFSVGFTVTDANKVTATASIGLTISAAPLRITTTGISPAQLGQSFTVGFGATGGTTPYTWSASGLPAGITMSASGTLGGTPTQVGTFPIVVTVTDANKTTASEPLSLVVSLPSAPGITYSGLPSTGASGTQVTSPVTFTNTYPVDVTITLTLTFAPVSGPDDPNIQFSTGGRTTTVTVKAGSTVSLSNISVQTGTVAGTITITATLNAGGTDITPVPAPARTIVIPPSAPTISSATETSSGSTFTVVVVGFDPTRAVTQLTFTFTPAAGSTLQTSTVTVSATSLFTAWWQSSQSAQYGSQFSFTIPFTVSGSVSGIASVSVTATNATGTSNSVTATIH